MNPLDDPNSRRVVVVCHADDEVLWAGGLMLRYPGDWTVVCCSTPRRDPERMELFVKSCAILGAKPVSLPILETNALLKEDLVGLDVLPDLSGFDLIVTHGAYGEYACHHHVQLHRFMAGLYPGAPMLFFAYGSREPADIELVMTAPETARKLQALQCYDNIFIRSGRRIRTWVELYDKFFGARLDHLSKERHVFRA